MGPHPVQFHVETSRMQRGQVMLRLLLLAALGAIGWSSIYWLLYLVFPIIAALLVSRDGGARYLDDAPPVVRALRWFAGTYAYLWLLTDVLPDVADVPGPVELRVAVGGRPTVGSTLSRLVTSLPALLVLGVLSLVGVLFWIVGVLAILANERVPAPVSDFIAMKLRYQFRLIAYHLSLVDAYPALVESSVPRPAHG